MSGREKTGIMHVILQRLMDDIFDLRANMSSQDYLLICDTLHNLHKLVELEGRFDAATGRHVRSTRRRAVKALCQGVQSLKWLESIRAEARIHSRREQSTRPASRLASTSWR